MRTNGSVLVLVFLCSLFVARSGIAKDEGDLDGTWVPANAELGGKPFPEEVLKTMRLVVKDGKYAVTVGKSNDQGDLKINRDAMPKEVDIKGTEGPTKGKTLLAIYERSGDTLRICYDLSGQKRPLEFKTNGQDLLFLVNYKRVTP